MKTLTQKSIIGIDVSREWLDIYCHDDETLVRVRNMPKGHHDVITLAHEMAGSCLF